MIKATSALMVALLISNLHADDPTKKIWYPTAIGTTWTFRTNGSTFKQVVVAHEKIGKIMCAKIMVRIDGQDVISEHVGVTSDGIYRCAAAGREVSPPVKILPLPVPLGKGWDIKSKTQGQTIEGRYVVSRVKGGMKVGGKKYPNVLLIKTDGDLKVDEQKLSTQIWLAEGIGMIKQKAVISGVSTTIELVEFEPKKKKKKSLKGDD